MSASQILFSWRRQMLASGKVSRAGAALASDLRSVMSPFANALLAECGRRGLEGIVCKRKDSVHRSGSHSSWIKVGTEQWYAAARSCAKDAGSLKPKPSRAGRTYPLPAQ
jgi:ATP-dependent DNA ligase